MTFHHGKQSINCRFQIFKSCWRPPGNARWWAELELLIFLVENFDNVAIFCITADGDSDMNVGRSARMGKLKDTMENNVTRGVP